MLSYASVVSSVALGLERSRGGAKILNVPGGTLSEGAPADITLLAPDLVATIDPAKSKSRSRNTPFGGWTLKGGVAGTIVGGRLVYTNDAVTSIAGWQSAAAR